MQITIVGQPCTPAFCLMYELSLSVDNLKSGTHNFGWQMQNFNPTMKRLQLRRGSSSRIDATHAFALHVLYQLRYAAKLTGVRCLLINDDITPT